MRQLRNILVLLLLSSLAYGGSWFDGPPTQSAVVSKREKKDINRLLKSYFQKKQKKRRRKKKKRAGRYSRPYQAALIPTPRFDPAPQKRAPVQNEIVDAYVAPPEEPKPKAMVPWHLLMQDNTPLDSKKNRLRRLKSKRKRKRLASRGSASLAARSRAKVSRRHRSRGLRARSFFRLSLLGGLNSASSGSAYRVSTPSQSGVSANKNFAVGANAEMRRSYFGFELGGQLGLGSQTSNAPISVYSGAMAHAYLNTRVKAGKMKITPLVGLGYALHRASQSGASELGVAGKASFSTQGVYAIVGLEFLPFRSLLVRADYLKSIAARSASTLQGVVDGSGAGLFDQFRLTTYLQLAPSYSIGLQFVHRGHGLKSVGKSEFSDQFLGLMMYQF